MNRMPGILRIDHSAQQYNYIEGWQVDNLESKKESDFNQFYEIVSICKYKVYITYGPGYKGYRLPPAGSWSTTSVW